MAKNYQVTDLVPVQVLLNIAKRVRSTAAKIAKSKHVPLAPERTNKNKYSANHIGITAPTTTKNQVSVNLTLTDVALAFEYGSDPHPIDPVNKKALWFPYPEGKIFPWVTKFEKNGQIGITTQHVNHPGFQKKPFLKPAKDKTRRQNLEDIRKTNLANTRLIISAMKRVV